MMAAATRRPINRPSVHPKSMAMNGQHGVCESITSKPIRKTPAADGTLEADALKQKKKIKKMK